jgi:hypothetical protein
MATPTRILAWFVTTDPQGHYECDHLRPGLYAISALAHGILPTGAGQKHDVYTRTFYPSTLKLDTATLIHLSPGQNGMADILVHPVHTASLHGKLSNVASPVSLTVLSQAAGYELPTQVKAEYDSVTGKVSMPDTPQGSYVIKADWWASGAMQHTVATVDVSGGISDELKFLPLITHPLIGTIHAPPDCQNCLPQTLSLRRVDAQSTWSVLAPVSSDGSFSFPPAPDGDYVIAVSDPAHICIRDISVGGKSLSSQRLGLHGSVNPEPLDLEVEHTQVLLAGKLDTSHLVPGESGVVLQNTANGSFEISRADASGHFEFSGLVPAAYRLFAWDDLDGAEFRNPEFLNTASKQAILITVEDKTTRMEELSLLTIDSAK